MAVVIEVDCAAAVGEAEMVALEASLNRLRITAKLRFGAQAVAVAATMLGT
jgi:hypothetical protein